MGWIVRVLVVALLLAACSSAVPAPDAAPSTPGTSQGSVPQLSSAAVSGTSDSAAPPTGIVDQPGAATEEPLPQPSLTDPADIAAAIFDPSRVADGVVSLADAVGVTVVDATGSVVRHGADRGAGTLQLSERELRGMIAMTSEDLRQGTDAADPVHLSDVYAALQPFLPASYTADDLAAAYDQAFVQDRGSLAAQLMRGQRIEAGTSLLRVQLWLLLVDGFVARRDRAETGILLAAFHPGIANPRSSRPRLASGASVGIAAQRLPTLTIPAGFTATEFGQALAELPLLDWGIGLRVVVSGVIHEGHGGPGTVVSWSVRVTDIPPVTSTNTGKVLFEPWLRKGVKVTWDTDDLAPWQEHGAFESPLNVPIPMDAAQGAEIRYAPDREDADGRGTLVSVPGDLHAHVGAWDLVDHAYDLGPLRNVAYELIHGGRSATGGQTFPIHWHQLGTGYVVDITWIDRYNGIDDRVSFHGILVNRDPTIPGLNYWAHGMASGSRPGWTACNPGIDVIPSGEGGATFTAGIQGDEVVIGAYPQEGTPMAGILAGPFVLPVTGGTASQWMISLPSSDLCPHSQAWEVTATPVGDPLHP